MTRIWAFLLLTIILLVALAPLLSSRDPLHAVPAEQFAPPSAGHLLGTDHLGRDVFSRLLWGGRASLLRAAMAALLASVGGTFVGGLAGLLETWAEQAVMRIVDVLLTFPGLLMAIALVALFGVGGWRIALAVGISLSPGFSRVVRAAVLTARQRLYVQAARGFGAGPWHIFRVHILPAIWSQVLSLAIVNYAWALLSVASLEFLGFTGSPSDPSWGAMLNQGRSYLDVAPWIALTPAALLTLTVMVMVNLGDSRPRSDPWSR
jgi:peptide/nickel transport system permease protein